MFRKPSALALAAALATFTGPALAASPEAEVTISHASAVFVSVSNQSNSTDADERQLVMNGPAQINVAGDVACTRGSAIDEVWLLFGSAFIHYGTKQIVDTFAWDASAPVTFPSSNAASYDIDHELALPTTWQPSPINLTPNAVAVVEEALEDYVSGGGSAVDFLRTDAVFETTFPVNAALTCSARGTTIHGLATREVTLYVLYQGDPRIAPQPVGGGPGGVAAPTPPRPPVAVFAPRAPRSRWEVRLVDAMARHEEEGDWQLVPLAADVDAGRSGAPVVVELADDGTVSARLRRGGTLDASTVVLSPDGTQALVGILPDEIDFHDEDQAGIWPDDIDFQDDEEGILPDEIDFHEDDEEGILPDEIDFHDDPQEGILPEEIDFHGRRARGQPRASHLVEQYPAYLVIDLDVAEDGSVSYRGTDLIVGLGQL